MHLLCGLVIFVGFSWPAFWVCIASVVIRTFGITAGFHRYFSHRSFSTSRTFQFLLAVLGCTAGQEGPLWWASHHRDHHRHSDQPPDIHSPVQETFWYSHVGWLFDPEYAKTKYENVRDFTQYREIVLLNEFYFLVCGAYGLLLFLFGGLQMFVWGYVISTTLLYHITFSINSFTHLYGYRTFDTTDNSRNNPIVGILALGEGWHNNHHRHPSRVRHGIKWWEVDITYLVLKGLSIVRLVKLKQAPAIRQ